MNIHLMGVCGAGMSALAAWYKSLGNTVSGCDGAPSISKVESLNSLGITVQNGHSVKHLHKIEKVVFSAAIPQNNPELLRARELSIPVLRRSEALAELALSHRVISIAGAHGKTTTTSMMGWILQELGLNPTVFVGGHVNAWQGNYRPGGNLAVIESDEFDRTFLRLTPSHAAVTSFALEHLECYGSPEALEWAFQAFLESVLPGGTVIVPVEKPGLGYWASKIGRKVLSAGPGGDIDAKELNYNGWGEKYKLFGINGFVPSPGIHNIRNAQIAVCLAMAEGVSAKDAMEALATWPGVNRRLEKIGVHNNTIIVSDYAHHPDELVAALSSLKIYSKGPLKVVFQPHLYSRTSLLYREMASALRIADRSYILPIYPAREKPVVGVTSALVCNSAVLKGANCSQIQLDQIEEEIVKIIKESDGGVLVFMGAGSIDRYAKNALKAVLE